MCRSRTRRRIWQSRIRLVGRMPVRATKRGDERTPLDGTYDVLICGASFAGLAVARELAGSGAEVLVLDRYEIGERQTSACGIPTEWLRALGLMEAERQRFDSLVIHTPHGDARYRLPWTFSTFDYRELCELLWRDCDAAFETAKVNGRAAPANGDGAIAVETDRGGSRAPLVVDALGWRRVLGRRRRLPAARRAALARAGGAPRAAPARTSRSGSTAATSPPATAGPSPPATSCGSASAPSTPASTSRRRPSCWPRTSARDRVRYQGNWIPHKLRRGDRGRRLLRRRLGRALPAADRRGDPHRALLRDRAGPRAARRGRGTPEPRAGGAPLRRVQRLATSGSSAGCCASSGWSRGCRRACSGR